MDDYPEDSFSDLESDIFSLRSGPSSATSCDVSMRSGSPAPSMYSVTSSIRAASYRQQFGRGLNNYSEVYQLPADDEELDRLGIPFLLCVSLGYLKLRSADKQHEMFKKIMGAYPPPMAEVMADDTPGEIKAVLDLGCGSGSWFVTSPLYCFAQPVPTTFQDNGCRSRLSTLSGCCRGLGPNTIYASHFSFWSITNND